MSRLKPVQSYRRPSTIFTIGEDSGDDSDKYNEFDSDVEIGGSRFDRRESSVSVYSSDTSLDSDSEMEKELKERGQLRRPSVAPAITGLQTWVDIKGGSDATRRSSVTELLQVPSITVTKKRKFTYDEIRDFVVAGRVKDMKHAIRESDWGVTEDLRTRLWPLLDSIHEKRTSDIVDGFYWETVNQIFGSDELPDKEIPLPGLIDQNFKIFYNLSDEGKRICERVVSVIHFAYPDITYCPLLIPLVSLFLHYVQEEKTFNCICTLLTARQKVFMTQTKMQWDVTCHTIMLLTKKFSKSAYNFVTRHLKEGEKPELIFQQWAWWIFRDLPLSHLVRVIDCFLMEGNKVLYRTAIALLLSFSKHANSDSRWSNSVETVGITETISAYIREIAIPPSRLLKSAFAIRAFSGAEIHKISASVQLVKSKVGGGHNTVEALPNNMDTQIQTISHTMTIKELLTLWSWLPARITMYQPVLLYTTEEHGCSLTTFFNRVDNHEPTVLLIKATTDEVFGAYLSTQWSCRNTKDERGDRVRYFGTGETFLFSLWPNQIKYPWVGIKDKSDSDDCDNKVAHSSELFMHAETNMISIGGGQGQGIYLDEELRFGKSETCSTFNNPPLVSTRDFEVRVLEVFGFTQV